MEPPRHGGALAWATARYGMPAEGWLDLSTGINPRPYPFPAPGAGDFARLPDPAATAALAAAARGAYGAPPTAAVAAVPGSEVALRLAPLVAPDGAAAIVGPTYGSHAAAWQAAGRRTIACATPDRLPEDAAILVLCNPNNPDGRLTPAARLAELGRALAARGGLLVVDEAFADLAPGASLVPHLAGLPAVVFRSFGKFYGLAGLRLGFALGATGPVERLAGLLGDWPVSGPAVAIAGAALADRAWQAAARDALKRQTAALRQLLVGHRLAVAGGTDLFTLVADPQAHGLHEALARRGIWTRAFADNPQWLRFGLPGSPAGLARLDRALGSARDA